jgi:hypothetical protein
MEGHMQSAGKDAIGRRERLGELLSSLSPRQDNCDERQQHDQEIQKRTCIFGTVVTVAYGPPASGCA